MTSVVLRIAPDYNLSRYLQEICNFPMLAPEERLALAHRWRDT
jgi:RNA polymerase sigma-32 factor